MRNVIDINNCHKVNKLRNRETVDTPTKAFSHTLCQFLYFVINSDINTYGFQLCTFKIKREGKYVNRYTDKFWIGHGFR